MLVKIISVTFNSAYGGFDDTELRNFIKDIEVISITDHMFVRNEIPYLTLIVKYFPLRREANPKLAPQGKRDEPWRQNLSETDMGLFNLLRDWRSKQSKKEGLPPYVLFTNKELAQIVKDRPQSLADLAKIDGIGKAKIEKYGTAILDISNVGIPPSSTTPVPAPIANPNPETQDDLFKD